MPETSPSAENPDRRERVRAATARHALFSSYERGMLGQGSVVDISPDGVQIHCHSRLEAGQELDLDIYPKKGAGDQEVFRGRGRVAYVRAIENGEWAVGVHLLTALPAQAFSTLPRRPASPMPPSYTPPPNGELPTVYFQPSGTAEAEKVDRRQVAVLLALIACFLFLLMRACEPVTPSRGFPGASAAKEVAEAPTTQADLVGAQYAMDSGKPEEARQLFSAIALDTSQPLTERFIARLGEAEALAQSGKKDEALAQLDGLERASGVAAPWIRAAGDYAGRLRAGRGETGPLSGLSVPIPFSEPAPAPAQGKPPEFKIIVDKSDHTLELLHNNQPMALFPVGLGCETPEGEFRISAKLTTPDWNNRGRRVKAGDPKNPLGRRWMGLDSKKGPTPYGIHPTNEADSIGKDVSRGCIRMREQDAETIFQRCPSGTPVLIQL